MKIVPTRLADVKLIVPTSHADERGFFAETYNRRAFARAGIDFDFVQDNQSLSTRAGTVRGLHFQTPPHAIAKLVRVGRGAVFDVALDLRRGSPSYGRHVTVTLSAANGSQLLIPVGFAHGFCTLEPDTEVIYKVTGYYSPGHDAGIAWSDPALGIAWPVAPASAVLSERDRGLPLLADIPDYFIYP